MSAYFFSRIQLEASHSQAKQAVQQALVANAYQDHQWFWREFFPADPGTARDYIFRRIDSVEASQPPLYYVVSQRRPKPPHHAWQLQTREYSPQIPKGSKLHFELRANPVVTRINERNGKSTRRHEDVVMHAKKTLLAKQGLHRWQDWNSTDKPVLYDLVRQVCTQWLEGQGERHGFRLQAPESQLHVDGYQRHVLPGKKSSGARQDIVFSTVDFKGELEVIDPEKFRQALLKGVGHAKAFGCGLLLARRQ